MGRNGQVHVSPLQRLDRLESGSGGTTHDAAHDSAHEWGIGAEPAWLAPEDDSDQAEDHPANDTDDWEPSRRMLPAPPAALALIVVGILAVVVAGVLLVRTAPVDISPIAFPESAGPTKPVAALESSTPVSVKATEPASRLVISVVGLVNRPGLVRLSPQARVADAIAAAGGARPGADLLSLNLARPLRDGDQIIVGLAGGANRAMLRSAIVGVADPPGGPAAPAAAGPGAGGSAAAGPTGTSGGKVNLNTATIAELDTLPGVGPVTAAAILDWRTKHGRFTSVDQLGEVEGIGPARLQKLRERVTV